MLSTVVGSGGPEMAELSFPLLIMDEASKANELMSMIPLMKGAHQVDISTRT